MTYKSYKTYRPNQSYRKPLTIKTRVNRLHKARFFIRVAKSLIPKAVDRNLLKRRLRAILGKWGKPGTDYLVIYNSNQMLAYQELEKEITIHITKIQNPKLKCQIKSKI